MISQSVSPFSRESPQTHLTRLALPIHTVLSRRVGGVIEPFSLQSRLNQSKAKDANDIIPIFQLLPCEIEPSREVKQREYVDFFSDNDSYCCFNNSSEGANYFKEGMFQNRRNEDCLSSTSLNSHTVMRRCNSSSLQEGYQKAEACFYEISRQEAERYQKEQEMVISWDDDSDSESGSLHEELYASQNQMDGEMPCKLVGNTAQSNGAFGLSPSSKLSKIGKPLYKQDFGGDIEPCLWQSDLSVCKIYELDETLIEEIPDEYSIE
ncbi:hypothetical protein FGO68_gene14915 [Halteria grandinella]|uniref:Uncharacterized protein n=1 Tax=Halteria grandinella TaxID=5974 RepID=A0A8J8NNM3_HALGN|nr:hypothetical protein FGO68_gene14915 [Halteria grandinella]